MSNGSNRRPKDLKPKDWKELDRIEDMADRGNYEEAMEALGSLTRRNPNSVACWEQRLFLASEHGDSFTAWEACQNLIELEPHEALHGFNIAVSCAQLGMLFSAEYYLNQYLERWPDGEHNDDVRKMREKLIPFVDDVRQKDELMRTADPEGLLLMETGNILVSHGRSKEGRRVCQQAIKKLPAALVAPLNNIALSYGFDGNLERALRYTEDTLKQSPQNVHALSNRAQFLIRLGRTDEAHPILEQLRQIKTDVADYQIKILEAFAYAGNDKILLEIYQSFRREFDEDDIPGFAHHLAAASSAREGDELRARILWKLALDTMASSPQLIHRNLQDLDLPAGQRNGPWHLEMYHWVAKPWIERLQTAAQRALKRGEQAIDREVRRVLKSTPELITAGSYLLHRGDPEGRQFALMLANHVPLDGLVDFALGWHGTDQQRMDAARKAVEHGLLDPSQPVKLYIQGEQRDLRLMSYAIQREPPDTDLPDEAEEKFIEGYEDLLYDEPDSALKQAEAGLALVPDCNEFLILKALALLDLERHDEATPLIQKLGENHGDDLLVRGAMVRLMIHEGQFDQADEQLKELLNRQELHLWEYRLLVVANVELSLARDDEEVALSWLAMWVDVDEDSIPARWDHLLETLFEEAE
jgi:tetratricopeptide (TPR) repeat protein